MLIRDYKCSQGVLGGAYKTVVLQGRPALIELPNVSKHQALKEQFLPFSTHVRVYVFNFKLVDAVL